MRRLLVLVLMATAAALPACGATSTTGDGDADGDSDVDGDADVDGDSDADSDGEWHEGRDLSGFTFAADGSVLSLARTFRFQDACGEQSGDRLVVLRIDPSEATTEVFDRGALEANDCWAHFDAADDGSRFAFGCTDGSFIVVDATGATIRTFDAAGIEAVVLSDDGARAALVVGDVIQAVDLPDGAPVDVVAGARSPAWSPDGSRIAFFAGSTLTIIDADGSDELAVASVSLPRRSSPIVWSADATTLYLHAEGGIYSAPAEAGAALTRIDELGDDSWLLDMGSAEVSPDGTSALVPEELAGFLVISLTDGSVLFEGWGSYLCG